MQVRRNQPRGPLKHLKRFNSELFNDPQILQKRLNKIACPIEIKNLKPLSECRYKDLQWNFAHIDDETKFFSRSANPIVKLMNSSEVEREKIKHSIATVYKQDVVEDKYRSDKAVYFNFQCKRTKYSCEKEFDNVKYRIIVNLGTDESILCHPKFLKFAENRFQKITDSIVQSEETQRELLELKREKNDRLVSQEDEKVKIFKKVRPSRTEKPGSIFENLISGVSYIIMQSRSEKSITLNSIDQKIVLDSLEMKSLDKILDEDVDDEVNIRLLFNNAQKFINDRLFKKSELKFLSKEGPAFKEEEPIDTSEIGTSIIMSMEASDVNLSSKKFKKIFQKLSLNKT